MIILHVLYSNQFSGAENVVCQIIEMFKNDEDYHFVYCSRDGQISGSLSARGIEFEAVNKFTLLELRKVIKHINPDIIHAHDMKASFYVALICGSIPFISQIHNNNFDSRVLSAKSVLYAYAANKAKSIIWVSQEAYDGYFWHEKYHGKSKILYNVLDAAKLEEKVIEDTNDYQYDVVYLGRLTYQKNPKRLLTVLNLVIMKRPETKIAVIGTGDLESETNKIAEDLDIYKNIDFLGYQNNPYKMLKQSKCMIMTSRWEGLPMCALESLALGVPVVSTPTDGLKHIIVNDENGFLSDDNQVLADKICEIINDESLFSYLSEGALKFSEEHMNVKKYKETLIEIYRDAINNK